MKLSTGLFLTTAIILSASQSNALVEVGARAAYWLPKLSGDLSLDGASEGDTLNLTDKLGMEDENFFIGDAWLWIGDSHITISGMQVKYSGSKDLNNIDFGDKTFGADTDSTLEYKMLDLSYQYDLLDLENCLAGFSIGPSINAKYIDGEVKLSAGNQEESQSFKVILPMVGVGAHMGILSDILEVRARAAVLPLDKNYILDYQGEISYNPLPFIELVGGYKGFVVNVEKDDLLLDYNQTGPYVGLSLILGI